MEKEKSILNKESIYILSVTRGLTFAIPFLIMGAFAMLFNNFPFTPYQLFLEEFLEGKLSELLNTLYNVSLGSLALVLIITISLSFGHIVGQDDIIFYPIVALCSYLAFCGGIEGQTDYIFKAEWVFTAMCITMCSCVLFRNGMKTSGQLERLHTIGADYIFNLSMQGLASVIVITAIFGILGIVLRHVLGYSNITNFGSFIFLKLFSVIGGNLFGILLYVFCTHLLWFLGIHGTNTLEAVSQRLFENGLTINQAFIQSGQAPTEIYSKTFLDTFVFMGGCGASLCLVFALLISAQKSHNRKLAWVSFTSVFFNISEIAVFGFPVIFNPIMIVPFILTPLVLVLTSSLFMYLGIVPLCVNTTGWTVPVILSGYQVTGSAAGSLLQIGNLLLGTCIYIPFVKRSERRQVMQFSNSVKIMEEDMRIGEAKCRIPEYLSNGYSQHYYAKSLAQDLKNAVQRSSLELFYQVQIKRDETVHGAEALLRWKHPIAGYISPPLLISLSYESGIMDTMGYYLIEKVLCDMEKMEAISESSMHISVNISPKQLEKDDFVPRVREILHHHSLGNKNLVFEITERIVMETSDELIHKIKQLNLMGIEISMDDFGMGHSSMIYLQNNLFDEVKLDGGLVSQILVNERSVNIISGIIHLAKTLNFRVVAEYVETREQRDLLKKMGCDIVQGYYYGMAEELEQFMDRIKNCDSQITEELEN